MSLRSFAKLYLLAETGDTPALLAHLAELETGKQGSKTGVRVHFQRQAPESYAVETLSRSRFAARPHNNAQGKIDADF